MSKNLDSITENDRLNCFKYEVKRFANLSDEDKITDFYKLFIHSVMNELEIIKKQKSRLNSYISMLEKATDMSAHDDIDMFEDVLDTIEIIKKDLEEMD